MDIYQKIVHYKRLPNDPGTDELRMQLVLENGTEFVLLESKCGPSWSFTVRMDANPGSLGVKYDMDADPVQHLELSGAHDDYRAFNEAFYEGVENAA